MGFSRGGGFSAGGPDELPAALFLIYEEYIFPGGYWVHPLCSIAWSRDALWEALCPLFAALGRVVGTLFGSRGVVLVWILFRELREVLAVPPPQFPSCFTVFLLPR